ncbi:hypothetical protein [Flavobacterium sp.]|uniref:hypothetical protein n=1 Tax=Flavobacterium sp. TaxID=239 RepID=UPI00286A5B43|nr:hypothetical protein [Flavobacterium sp.]
MKKFILCIILSNTLLLNAQTVKGINGEKNWLKSWTNFKPKLTDYNEPNEMLTGVIDKNTTLYKKNIYLIVGKVYIANNAVLTIEPGTLIRGDFDTRGMLVITKGSKIIANGEESNPIVFTSNKSASERKPGDWGGVVVMGEANINKFGNIGYLNFNLDSKFNIYGGENVNSSSGSLKYVRIEFAGGKNRGVYDACSLILAGIGSGTKVDFVQVSYSKVDSFEFLGGQINMSNMVSFRANKDDFDFTEGIQAKINNSIAIRNSYYSDSGKSRAFEIDSYDLVSNADLTKKLTKVVAKNITMINEDVENTDGLLREAIFIKENAYLEMSNSVVSGFNQCVLLDANLKINFDNLEKIKFQNILLNNCKSYINSEITENNKQLESWYNNEKFNIECSKVANILLFMELDFKNLPDLQLKNNNLLTSRLANN